MGDRPIVRTTGAPIRIRVRGAMAELHGLDPGKVLPHCLSFKHPEARHSRAYREGDWDGMVSLFSGRAFPAGLSQRVIDWLVQHDLRVELVELRNREPIDLSRLTPTYMVDPTKPGFELREYQLGGARAMLENVRGIAKAPTGSGKTETMAIVARYFWEELGWRTLVIEPKLGVAIQTARRFALYYGSDVAVGLFAGGHRDIGPVIVATAQTMLGFKPRTRKGSKRAVGRIVQADPLLRDVVRQYEVLIFDECHRTSSETWFDLAMQSGARRRFGLSATPIIDEDLRDARLIGATGPVIFSVPTSDLIAQGYAARPKIVMVMHENASGPELPVRFETFVRNGVRLQRRVTVPYAEAYEKAIVQNDTHNRAVIRAVAWLVEKKRQVIVLCRRKSHFLRLAELLEEAGIEFAAVWGATDVSDRDHAKRAFAQRRIPVALATTIWDEGEDIPSVEAIVLAEGVKVSTNSRQRVGRGMRPDSEDCWVVDFVPTGHPTLIEHAYRRALAYESEGYEVRVLDTWPAVGEQESGELLPFLSWDTGV